MKNNTQLSTPTPESLYRSILKRIGTASSKNDKLKLKKDISRKYYQHMSLLQNHHNRQSRFQQSHNKMVWKNQQNTQKLKHLITLRQETSKQARQKHLQEKRKKTQQALRVWQNSVKNNQNSYQLYLKNSEQFIKKWNQKCQSSIEKKNNLLNCISQNIRQKSRILSASSLKNRSQSYAKLQEALLNPEKTKMTNKNSRKNKYSTVSICRQYSRISTRLNSEQNEQKKKSIDNKVQLKYLTNTVGTQTRIKQARLKKNEQLQSKRQQKDNKLMELNFLRDKNLKQLKQKNQQMETKLDRKYKMVRQKKLQYSLPFIRQPKQKHIIQDASHNLFFTQINTINSKTLEPTYDKLIIQQLRNLSLITKNKSRKY